MWGMVLVDTGRLRMSCKTDIFRNCIGHAGIFIWILLRESKTLMPSIGVFDLEVIYGLYRQKSRN